MSVNRLFIYDPQTNRAICIAKGYLTAWSNGTGDALDKWLDETVEFTAEIFQTKLQLRTENDLPEGAEIFKEQQAEKKEKPMTNVKIATKTERAEKWILESTPGKSGEKILMALAEEEVYALAVKLGMLKYICDMCGKDSHSMIITEGDDSETMTCFSCAGLEDLKPCKHIYGIKCLGGGDVKIAFNKKDIALEPGENVFSMIVMKRCPCCGVKL